MSTITSHVLNTVTGKPAEGVKVELSCVGSPGVFSMETNTDGRILNWGVRNFTCGEYIVKFYTREYFSSLDQECFYRFVEIRFDITENNSHIHIPLLISNYGYTTYKGS